MLRQRAAEGARPPEHRPRRAGRLKAMALGALALAGAAVAAQAEGLPRGPTILADFPLPLVYDWSGLYFGGDVIPTFDGVIAGGHIGFNRQVSRWVFGLQASLSGGDLGGRHTDTLPASFLPGVTLGGATLTHRFDIDGLLLATARLGHARDRWLGYVKGGYASVTIESRQFAAGTVLPFAVPFEAEGRTRERHHGWTLGAGVEYAVTDNIILGLEYNFIDIGQETHRSRLAVDAPPLPPLSVIRSAAVDPAAAHTAWARLSF
jgi:outer membrane immunogenic protein